MMKRRMEYRPALSGCSVRHSNSGLLRIGKGQPQKGYIRKKKHKAGPGEGARRYK